MYKLIETRRYAMTRDLYFENVETGRIELVFDDNEHTRGDNFSFLELNNVYDCKLVLFGKKEDKVYKISDDVKNCHFISKEKIGLIEFAKVEEAGNTYYVSLKGLGSQNSGEDFYIKVTRIDLAEVNGVVHRKFLDEILTKHM